MTYKTISLAAVILSTSLTTQLNAATTVYSDDFTDDTTGWHNSGSSSGIQNVDETLRSINSTARFLTYFDSTTLAVGESITVSFDLTLGETGETIGDSANKFRIGILDSGGAANQVVGNYGSTNAAFTNYSGYRLNTNVGAATADATTLSTRNGTGTSLLGDGMTALSNTANGLNLTAGQAYDTSFTFTRTNSTTLSLTFSIDESIVLSTTDTSGTFTFDTIAFYEGNVATDTTLDNVLVIVPESKHAGLLIGILTLFALPTLRRRARA